MTLGRHALAWLSPRGWESVQASTGNEPVEVRDALARWRAAGWPLVVRRRSPDEQAPGFATGARSAAVPDAVQNRIPLGLALPPHARTGVKPRIAVMVERADTLRLELPTPLSSVLPAAPPQWRAGLLALHMESMEAPLGIRVFGSLAWQAITGMPYLRGTSDIDLLIAPASRRELALAMDLLQRHGAGLPLDGEIVFPSGAAVAWKEWRDVAGAEGNDDRHRGAARVMVKTSDNVALMTCDAVLASFDRDTWTR